MVVHRVVSLMVAPYTGAWIEIAEAEAFCYRYLVAPYTGAWIEIYFFQTLHGGGLVAPYTGAWIEIRWAQRNQDTFARRTLHGCVD